MKKDLRDILFQELEEWIVGHGYPKYRAGQIFDWLYKKNISSIYEAKNLPLNLQNDLNSSFVIFIPRVEEKQISKVDGTVKYLLKLSDGEMIESAIIPAENRLTMCISTQVGCRFRCKFCASGLSGLKRNMTAAEIVSQIIIAQKDGYKLTNIVFMGTGEPLDNYDNLCKAIKIINDKHGLNIGARKITVSTSGIPEGIKNLSKVGIQIELSISLHAADNKKRDELMPINKLYPIEKVLGAVKEYIETTNRVVTFEYVLLKNVNDSAEDAKMLAVLLNDLKCKVNLIPFSPLKEFSYETPDQKRVKKFCNILSDSGIPATIRMSKGTDISAACGQLRTQNT
jgi:23S rRNA (adenine2503-C2)-methyltransferase